MMAQNVTAKDNQRGTYQSEISEVSEDLGDLGTLAMHGGGDQGGS